MIGYDLNQFQATIIGQGVALNTPTTVPVSNGQVLAWNIDGTVAWLTPYTASGSGTQLQHFSGAVTGSSVSGANVTLGGMLDIVGPTLLFRATSTGNDAMWVLTNSAAVSGGLLIELDGNKSAYLWNGENAPLYFGTNNSLRWTVSAAGHFIAGSDNTYDIGQPGATRPRNVHVGNLLVVENNITTSASITAGPGYGIAWAGRSGMYSPSDGVIGLVNAANDNFDRLQFGGTTSSFPALKRSGTTLQCRDAADGGYAPFEAAKITSDAGVSVGPITFAVLNAMTPTSGLGEYRITDRDQKRAYPDGTNWRFVGNDAIIL